MAWALILANNLLCIYVMVKFDNITSYLYYFITFKRNRYKVGYWKKNREMYNSQVNGTK